MAWMLSAIAMAFLGVTLWADEGTPWGAIALLVIMLLSAGSISLGNWVDRQTVLSLGPEGLQFRNGLRTISFTWNEIQEVRVLASAWGQRVQVLGPDTSFIFRTLGEVRVHGDLKGEIGFAQGALILKEILASAGLTKRIDSEKVRYYSRP